jgi:hypothetical protein
MKSVKFGDLEIGDEFKEHPLAKTNLKKISTDINGNNAEIVDHPGFTHRRGEGFTVWIDEGEK